MNTRYHSLDALRASMMFLGLVIHIIMSYMTLDMRSIWPIKDPHPDEMYNLPLVAIHVFRMPVFFVISGFFTHLILQRYGMTGMLRNRTKKILLPFLFIVIPMNYILWAGMNWGNVRFRENAGELVWNSLANIHLLTTHLWFLYYLIIFYVALTAIWWLGRILSLNRFYVGSLHALSKTVAQPWSVLLLTLAGYTIMQSMAVGTLETSLEFWPLPWRSLTTYFLYFLFGWVLFVSRDALRNYQKYGIVFTLFAIIPLMLVYALSGGMASSPELFPILRQGVMFCSGLSVALVTYGLIGLFSRYLEKPSKTIRYLADSSYWVYVMHLPLVIFFAVLMFPWNVPSLLKAGINLVLTTGILLLSYEYCVRRTWVGYFLGCRRASASHEEKAAQTVPAISSPVAQNETA